MKQSNLTKAFEALGDNSIHSDDVTVKRALVFAFLQDNPHRFTPQKHAILLVLHDADAFNSSQRRPEDVGRDHFDFVLKAFDQFKPLIHRAFAQYVQDRNQQYNYAEAA